VYFRGPGGRGGMFFRLVFGVCFGLVFVVGGCLVVPGEASLLVLHA